MLIICQCSVQNCQLLHLPAVSGKYMVLCFNLFWFCVMCMDICLCVCAPYGMSCTWGAQRWLSGPLELELTGDCELPCRHWELNLGSFIFNVLLNIVLSFSMKRTLWLWPLSWCSLSPMCAVCLHGSQCCSWVAKTHWRYLINFAVLQTDDPVDETFHCSLGAAMCLPVQP